MSKFYEQFPATGGAENLGVGNIMKRNVEEDDETTIQFKLNR